MPYKDPEKQRAYQAGRKNTVRRYWLQKQKCALCGQRTNLRVFKHAGASHLSWGLKGPNHDKFRVVCGDAASCLERRGGKEVEEPERREPKQRRKHRKKQPPVDDVEKPTLSRLAKELAKVDIRARCPVHGPKGTTVLHKGGRATFICCGREVG